MVGYSQDRVKYPLLRFADTIFLCSPCAEYLASKMHNTVGAIISLFKRDGRKDTQQGTAYEAVQVEDLDGDLQRTHSQDVPMREINRQ